MRLEERHAVRFIERLLLQIHAGRVDVRRRDADAAVQRFAAHAEKDHRLAAVVEVAAVADLDRVAQLVGRKAGRLRGGNGGLHRLALGLRAVEEAHIVFGKCKGRLRLLGGKLIGAFLLVNEFFHFEISFAI